MAEFSPWHIGGNRLFCFVGVAFQCAENHLFCSVLVFVALIYGAIWAINRFYPTVAYIPVMGGKSP